MVDDTAWARTAVSDTQRVALFAVAICNLSRAETSEQGPAPTPAPTRVIMVAPVVGTLVEVTAAETAGPFLLSIENTLEWDDMAPLMVTKSEESRVAQAGTRPRRVVSEIQPWVTKLVAPVRSWGDLNGWMFNPKTETLTEPVEGVLDLKTELVAILSKERLVLKDNLGYTLSTTLYLPLAGETKPEIRQLTAESAIQEVARQEVGPMRTAVDPAL